MNKKFLIIIFIAISIFGALVGYWMMMPKNSLDVDVSDVEKSVTIKHFDQAFFETDTNNFSESLNELKPEFTPFFTQNQPIQFWRAQRTNSSQIQLYSDLKSTLPNFKNLDEQIEIAFKHLYFYYPDVPEFTLYTYISNLDFEYPILIAEDFVFVATDIFLGKNHPAYAQQNVYENYVRQPQFITREVMQQFALNMAMKNMDDNTLLNEMIWHGKQLYFMQAMQPRVHDTIIAAMPLKKLEFCLGNEAQIWTFFVDNQLLFDTQERTKRHFIHPAPFSKFGMPFDNETPGMIGRWIGWKIVQSYMQNNPDVSLQQLMQNGDAQSIFKLSKYKP